MNRTVNSTAPEPNRISLSESLAQWLRATDGSNFNSDIRTQVFAVMLLLFSVMLFAAAVYVQYFSAVDDSLRFLKSVTLFAPGCFFLGLFLLYRAFGRYLLFANLAVLGTYVAVSLGVYYTGGPFASSVIYLAPVPALFAIFLCGIRIGFVWAFVVILTLALLVGYAHWGFVFPDLRGEEPRIIDFYFDWLLAYVSIITIVAVYEELQRRLKKERDLVHSRFEYLATHDSLTGLPNRHLFYDRIACAIDRARRDNSSFGLMYIDLDRFKPVNDRYGHQFGDQVLKVIAERICNSLRSSDTVARLGGDEFTLVIENLVNENALQSLAEHLLCQLTRPIRIDNIDIELGASIGLAVYPGDSDTMRGLINLADRSMYAVKNSQGNAVMCARDLLS